MPQKKYVVQIEGTDMFLIGYNAQTPPESLFGNLSSAVEYDTLEEAQTVASAVGGGTVGTTKPNH